MRATAIWIAAALVMPCPAAAAGAAAGPGLLPYVETRASGAYVDWLEGRVGVIGRSRIFRDIEHSEAFYDQTRLSADRDGQGKVLDLLAEMPRDGGARLGADAALMVRFDARLKGAPPGAILRDRGRMFEVEQHYPLWGPGSILDLVLEATPEPAPSPAATTASAATMEGLSPAPESPGGSATGLIIDARDVESPTAALLPRILDDKGRLIFGVEVADRGRALQRGLAAYALTFTGDGERLPGVRQGASPLRVRARSVTGATRADLVVSTADADLILKAAAASTFLRECRVVVLMPPAPALQPKPTQRPDINPPPATVPPDPKKP